MRTNNKIGVFIARFQPIHNGHLEVIKRMVSENDRILILIGSSNKYGMIRNPLPCGYRKGLLVRALNSVNISLDNIKIDYLPDYSTENNEDDLLEWGDYLYYNIVSRIKSKKFSIYYSDNIKIISKWFTKHKNNVFIRHIDRKNILDGCSATKIRKALLNKDMNYLDMYFPNMENKDFIINNLNKLLQEIYKNPKEDFSLE